MENENEPTIESLTKDVEAWRTHSREWEAKAKANLTSITELETKVADLDTLKADLDTAKADLTSKGDELAKLNLAVEFNLSADDTKLLVGDADAQRALAERLSQTPKNDGRMTPDPLQGRSKSTPTTAKDAFSAFLQS